MSRAKDMGVPDDAAVIAFGYHPETMRRHYAVLDETSTSDDVMDRLHGTVGGMNSSPGTETGEKVGRRREETATGNR